MFLFAPPFPVGSIPPASVSFEEAGGLLVVATIGSLFFRSYLPFYVGIFSAYLYVQGVATFEQALGLQAFGFAAGVVSTVARGG